MIQRISEGMTWYISQKDFLCSQTVITSVINLSIYLPIGGSNLLTTLFVNQFPSIASSYSVSYLQPIIGNSVFKLGKSRTYPQTLSIPESTNPTYRIT